ncbi:MAG TPA: GNAT family N-acetyltransferase [Bacteroidales bacterium]|jgi:RimJ/RimL family protein N-acetyltransferase|nr:GNAT family N-acetyltransferase [Bacteroidales bacterium]
MRFKLRPWKSSDIEDLVGFANNPKIAANLTNQFPHPYYRKDAEDFIKKVLLHDPMQVFAIEVDGKAAGAIGVFPQTDIHIKNLELGYWLAEIYWGKGITTEAVQQVVEYGFKTFDVDRIFSRPFGTNLSSQKVLEKAGFKLEGKFEKAVYKNGKYLDELVYAIRK